MKLEKIKEIVDKLHILLAQPEEGLMSWQITFGDQIQRLCDGWTNVKPEIVDWTKLNHSRDAFEEWVGHLIIAGIAGSKVKDENWTNSKNVNELRITLTINEKQVPLLPFLKRVYDDLDRQIQHEAEKMIHRDFDGIYDFIDSVRKSIRKRFPKLNQEED